MTRRYFKHVDSSNPSRTQWRFIARNSGRAGDCSRRVWMDTLRITTQSFLQTSIHSTDYTPPPFRPSSDSTVTLKSCSKWNNNVDKARRPPCFPFDLTTESPRAYHAELRSQSLHSRWYHSHLEAKPTRARSMVVSWASSL
ncbi:hypothetical protein MRB53_040720 [Persea americana]|nr:hypothetical protein MRB53_040720 [Persea americana]